MEEQRVWELGSPGFGVLLWLSLGYVLNTQVDISVDSWTLRVWSRGEVGHGDGFWSHRRVQLCDWTGPLGREGRVESALCPPRALRHPNIRKGQKTGSR